MERNPKALKEQTGCSENPLLLEGPTLKPGSTTQDPQTDKREETAGRGVSALISARKGKVLLLSTAPGPFQFVGLPES